MAKKKACSVISDPAMEREATIFAMELLMPRAWVERDMKKILEECGGLDEDHVEQLAKRYGVSAVVMTLRLCDLGYRELHV